jgi:AbrB family looped-hinge helix DNA binding protein
VRITSKGQVTVPIDVRQQLGLHEGDEVEFIVDGNSARIVRAEPNDSHGRRLTARLRGSGSQRHEHRPDHGVVARRRLTGCWSIGY